MAMAFWTSPWRKAVESKCRLEKGTGRFPSPSEALMLPELRRFRLLRETSTATERTALAIANNGSNNVTLLLAYVAPVITLAVVAPDPASFGQQLTLTAGVTPAAAAGYLTFFDGVTVLGSAPLAAGQAVLKSIALSPGQHSLHASYVGSGIYRGGISNIVSETVNAVASGSVPSCFRNPGFGGSESCRHREWRF